LFVLNPDLLSEQERSMVQARLKSNPDLEALAYYFEDFYTEFRQQLDASGIIASSEEEATGLSGRNLSASSTEFSDNQTTRIHLAVWRDSPTVTQPLVLAASSVMEGVHNVQTLYSEPGKTLVRILANFIQQRYELFMISETLEDGIPALLSVPGHDREYVIVNSEMTAVEFTSEDNALLSWTEGLVTLPRKSAKLRASDLLADGELLGFTWHVDKETNSVQVNQAEKTTSEGVLPDLPNAITVVYFDNGRIELVKSIPGIELSYSDLQKCNWIGLSFFS
jgi:hypothetical protein